MEMFTNDWEFSDIQIFQHSGKGIPLFMTGHKNVQQSDYLFGPGLCPIKQNLPNRGFTKPRNTALAISHGQFVSISFSLNVCGSYFEAVTVLQGDRINCNEYNFCA
jgi:hypothetical protein